MCAACGYVRAPFVGRGLGQPIGYDPLQKERDDGLRRIQQREHHDGGCYHKRHKRAHEILVFPGIHTLLLGLPRIIPPEKDIF